MASKAQSRAHLLAHREGLAVELLDELCSHLVCVIGVGVNVLLLQEVDLDGHGANALLGLVEIVQGNCEKNQQTAQLRTARSPQWIKHICQYTSFP